MAREADNLSVGELEEFLFKLPSGLKHLPVKIIDGEKVFYLQLKNVTFTDGKRYFSLEALKQRANYSGIYLELYGEDQ
jgi:hypothetical protein